MRNNKHTIFNNKQLAKRQISIKRKNKMTKMHKKSNIFHISHRIIWGIRIFVYICLPRSQ